MGKERLPEPGYVLIYIENNDGSISTDLVDIVYVGSNGKCKYNRGSGWHTLLWTCAPTRKQIDVSPEEFEGFVIHRIRFDTIEEVLESWLGYLVVSFPDIAENH